MGESSKSQFSLSSIKTEGLDDVMHAHDKQFLVFSSAGKPIYAYRGNEERLSSFMATAEALMSVVSDTRSESLRYIRSGRCVIAFLDRSPLCLVAISNLAEPPAVLRMQLALIHGQLLSLLTASAVASIFAKSPGYDARRLLGGADVMLESLISSFTATPAALLGAYPSLPLPFSTTRSQAAEALRKAVAFSKAAFGVLASGGAVVAIANSMAVRSSSSSSSHNHHHPTTQHHQLQQWDILLILNFLKSNASLKRAETFTPICLPTYNPNGHLHAYISFLDAPTSTAVVLLTGGPSPEFKILSEAQRELVKELEGCRALKAIKKAAEETSSICIGTSSSSSSSTPTDSVPPPPQPYPITYTNKSIGLESLEEALQGAGLGASCVLHCVYKKTPWQQYVMSPWAPAMQHETEVHRDVIVAYSQIRAAMFDHGGEHAQGFAPLQTLRYESRPRFSLVALSSPVTELYLAMDPLVGKAEAVRAGGEVLRLLGTRHDELFFSSSDSYDSSFGLFKNLYL